MTQVYLVGSGIASLSAAVFMLRDAAIKGSQITIFDYESDWGGSLDAKGDAERGYVCRGTRGFEFNTYTHLENLFSSVPSLIDPQKSIHQINREFCDKVSIDTKTRLMEGGMPIDASDYELEPKHLVQLTKIMLTPDRYLADVAIADILPADFFSTNFWWMFSTIFAFAPWHCAAEVRRYMYAFFQNVPDMHTLHSIQASPLNNYESIVKPLVSYLEGQGVQFRKNTAITDVTLAMVKEGHYKVTKITGMQQGSFFEIKLSEDDLVYLTLGSIAAPMESASWQLWRKLAAQYEFFGDPKVFLSQPEKSTMTTYTATCNDTEIYDLLAKKFHQDPQINRLTTFKDSPWSVSLIVPKQPWFSDQPKNTRVFWGHGIWPDGIGKYVPKKMADCSGDEILTELFHLLGLADVERLVAKTICHKTVLPTGHAQFLVRPEGTRPQVLPKQVKNLALLGQYVESDGTTYTMEYSIRTAMTAVYQHFQIKKKRPKTYRGVLNPYHQFRCLRTLLT